MLLKTHESWQSKSDVDAMFGEIGCRRYPFFELVLNTDLFHVDVLPKHEDPAQQLWTRFLVADLKDVLYLLGNDDFEKVRVSLQSRRCDNDDGEYAISTISEIIQGADEHGQISVVYKCRNGRSYSSSFSSVKEDDLLDKKTIYFDQT